MRSTTGSLSYRGKIFVFVPGLTVYIFISLKAYYIHRVKENGEKGCN